jgi:hypothetical protein
VGARGKFNWVRAARVQGVFCKTMDCGLIYRFSWTKTQNDHGVRTNVRRIAILLVQITNENLVAQGGYGYPRVPYPYG